MTTSLRILLLTVSSGILVSCSDQTSLTTNLADPLNSSIISGTTATAEDPISRSTVILNLPTGKYCSGVLLNDHVVLTAAHCVNRAVAGLTITVVVPEADRSCSAAAMAEISLAPKASPQDKFPPDLALLKLNRAICNAAPVALAPTQVKNRVLTAAGFGDGTNPGFPDTLNLKVISSNKKSLHALYFNDSPNDTDVLNDWKLVEDNYEEFSEQYLFALASNSNQSLCHGDSGGPVYQEQNGTLYIFGVVGGGFPHSKKGVAACQNTYVQLFAPIGPSIPWIQSTLKSW